MKQERARNKRQTRSPGEGADTRHSATGGPGGVRLVPHAAWHCLLIVLAGILVYANTFQVPFLFDDYSSILDNPVIKDTANFLSRPDGYRFNPRRFIGYLSFALNYRFGGLDVTGYHLVNLAIHLTNGLLVYTLTRLTLRTPRLAGSLLVPREGILALTASLLFVVHPVATQAVTYIAQRFASLATLFYLLALVWYVSARLRQSRVARLGDFGALALFTLAIAAAVLAFRTKEIAFTLPFALLLHESIFFNPTPRKRKVLLLAAAVGIAVVLAVIAASGSSLGQLLADVNERLTEARTISRGDYLVTQFRVVVTYLRLLILPVGQNLDYDYPLYASFLAPPVIVSFLLLAALLGVGGALLARASRGGDAGLRLVAFGIFWFFLTLAIESSVIPISDLIFEHRLYLPSAGALIAVAAAFLLLCRKFSVRACLGLFIPVLLILSAATWQRNLVWRDGLTLWQDVIAKSPRKARPYNELGKAFFDGKRYPEAIREYRKSLELAPDFLPAHNNLGAAYQKAGNLDAAIAEYRAALRLKPDQPEIHNNLGAAYDKKGWLDQAIVELEAALQLKADYAAAHNNLGAAYRKKGRMDEAVKEYRTALRLKPDYASAYNNLGIASAVSGRFDEAAGFFETAIRFDPQNGEFLGNLAKVHALKGAGEPGAASDNPPAEAVRRPGTADRSPAQK